jgi:hypothetical protein
MITIASTVGLTVGGVPKRWFILGALDAKTRPEASKSAQWNNEA